MLPLALTALVALTPLLPEPPTDAQVLAALPEPAGTRGDVEITKILTASVRAKEEGVRPAAHRWTCIAYYNDVVNGVTTRRVHVAYLEVGVRGKWSTPAIPKPLPYRR